MTMNQENYNYAVNELLGAVILRYEAEEQLSVACDNKGVVDMEQPARLAKYDADERLEKAIETYYYWWKQVTK